MRRTECPGYRNNATDYVLAAAAHLTMPRLASQIWIRKSGKLNAKLAVRCESTSRTRSPSPRPPTRAHPPAEACCQSCLCLAAYHVGCSTTSLYTLRTAHFPTADICSLSPQLYPVSSHAANTEETRNLASTF